MNLIDVYAAAVASGDIQNSLAQREVVQAFEAIIASAGKRGWPWSRRVSHQGLYVYGPVGAGKTYLMDLFYQHYPNSRKQRFHFHHFMQWVDDKLRQLQGAHDPLDRIADSIASSTQVLCLDEFLVHDVAHAMILGDLLQGVLTRGVKLIATANTAPDDLYRGGVHRERFLPAIALIQKACLVMELNVACDYRLGREEEAKTYFYPLTPSVQHAFLETFVTLAPHADAQGELTVQNRNIAYVRCTKACVWFDFNVICNRPRSQLDYLELASRFRSIFVSDIPALNPDDITRAVLLIRFVDVMYDNEVRLVISAAVSVDKIYPSGPMFSEFKRTLSRLQEMQSVDYLTRHVLKRGT